VKPDFDTDEGIGRRARLGVLVLAEDATVEPELARITALEGVALYHSRIPMAAEVRPDTLARMERELPDAVRLLPAAADLEVVAYACTSGATVLGSEAVSRAIGTVLPRARVTDPLAAILAAGRALEVRRLGLLTPYLPAISERLRGALEQAGFEIVAFGSFEQSDDRIVARITPTSILRAAEQVAQAAACEALVISCTSLRCLDILEELEQRTAIPAISSNQALGWQMLRLSGIHDPLPGFGRLLSER